MTALPLAAGGGGDLEWTLAAILAAVSVLFLLAYLSRIPYPIWLTGGGAVLAFLPGIPDVRLDPDLVLIIALPPLLYAAALYSDLRELRRNYRPIGLLAVPLVLVTTFGVAAVAHWMVEGCRGRRRSSWAPCSAPPTRSRRPRSRAAWAPRAGSSRCSRGRA